MPWAPPDHDHRWPGTPAGVLPPAVGIDVGGTTVTAVALSARRSDAEPEIRATRTVRTLRAASPLVGALDELIDSLLPSCGAGSPAVIGIGVPGYVDAAGIARQAPNLPAIVGMDLAAAIARRHRTTVIVDNDANCAAWAASTAASHLALVTFGTGIGGGLVIDGRLDRGAHGFAGEPGHMIVVADGLACVCGQRGCWEMYASGAAITRLTESALAGGAAPELTAAVAADPAVPIGAVLAERSSEGDGTAAAILDEHARWVAVGLVNIVNLFDPAIVVLGGGITAQGRPFLDRVTRALDDYPTLNRGRRTDLRLAPFGPHTGAVGAAMLAQQQAATAP